LAPCHRNSFPVFFSQIHDDVLTRVRDLYEELQGNSSKTTRLKLDFLEAVLARLEGTLEQHKCEPTGVRIEREHKRVPRRSVHTSWAVPLKHRRCLAASLSILDRYQPDIVVLQDTSPNGTRRARRVTNLNAAIAELEHFPLVLNREDSQRVVNERVWRR
jgi:hypothetical protein